MSGELKACGNCGCAAGVERNEYNWRVQYRVACPCGIASKWYKTRKDALGAWNLRVVTVEQVEKMARELAGGGGKNWCEALGATRAMLNAAGLGVAE